MRNWSIPIGKLFGVEVRLHFTFVFLLAFVWMAESAMKGNSTPSRVLALVLIVFGSVVLHEMGHALVARREGLVAKAIILLPIGGITLLDDPQPVNAQNAGRAPWQRDIRIAIAGPVVNIALALLAGAVVLGWYPEAHLWTKPLIHSNHLLRSVVWMNLFLGAFNLLPAYPMDGGHILRAIFSRRMDSVQATRRAVSIAHALAPLVIVVGMLLLFQGGQQLAGHAWIFPADRSAGGGTFRGIPESPGNRASRRRDAHRFRHALSRRYLGGCARQSRPHPARRFSRGARRRHGGRNLESQHPRRLAHGRQWLRAVCDEPDI